MAYLSRLTGDCAGCGQRPALWTLSDDNTRPVGVYCGPCSHLALVLYERNLELEWTTAPPPKWADRQVASGG